MMPIISHGLRRLIRGASGVPAGSMLSHDMLGQMDLIRTTEYFNSEAYFTMYPDVRDSGMDALEHFVLYGAKELRNPSLQFDSRHYLEVNEVESDNPLLHYLKTGAAEGLQVRPVIDRVVEVIVDSGIFDVDYYHRRYPEVAGSADCAVYGVSIGAVVHYVKQGAMKSYDPCEEFDTAYYLLTNRDVRAAKLNPLLHFIQHGAAELRRPSAWFDPGWYWLANMSALGSALESILHYRNEGKASGLLPSPGEKGISSSEHALLEIGVRAISRQQGPDYRTLLRVGAYLLRAKQWTLAEDPYRTANALSPEAIEPLDGLATALSKQNKHWQLLDVLNSLVEVRPEDVELKRKRINELVSMNRWDEAVLACSAARHHYSNDAEFHYLEGYCNTRAGRELAAREAYQRAIEFDQKLTSKRFGIGVFHANVKRWSDAERAYDGQLHLQPMDAELWYRRGYALDRLYRWEEALTCYERAVALQPLQAKWHYRRGFVLERLQRFELASRAYRLASELTPAPNRYWLYRQGYAEVRSGLHLQAVETLLRSVDMTTEPLAHVLDGELRERLAERGTLDWVLDEISACNPYEILTSYIQLNCTDSDSWFALGNEHERAGRFIDAVKAYRHAIDRQQVHRPHQWARLGVCLAKLGDHESAAHALLELRVQGRALGVDTRDSNPERAYLTDYAEMLETTSVREDVILYESYAGISTGCNPGAIFNEVFTDKRFEGFLHVWVVDSMERVPSKMKSLQNVVFTLRGSYLYSRYLATAGWLINNSTFPTWFTRRPEQRYLNTWHGTPLKTLGKDIRGNFMERKNTARNFLQATHLLSPNSYTTQVLTRQYDIVGSLSAAVAETGYPRVDTSIRLAPERTTELRALLGIEPDDKVVLYAPTWRGMLGDSTFECDYLFALVDKLEGVGCRLLFRGHYFLEALVRDLDVAVSVVSHDIDTAEVLAISDLLITDYSSIVFDFMPLNRPVLFYAYDLKEYAEERGLYFPPSDLGFPVCTNAQDVADQVADLLVSYTGPDTKVSAAMERFNPHDDGAAAKRAVDFFWFGATTHCVEIEGSNKTSMLFYGGAFPPNGITTSCLNLMSALADYGDNVVLAIDANAVQRSTLNMGKFMDLPASIEVLARTGSAVLCADERQMISHVSSMAFQMNEEMWSVYYKGYAREFRRMCGEARYNAVVQFDGYSNFWSSLFAGSKGLAERRVIYLHSDMKEEHDLRFPTLDVLFHLYRDYDELVSVSPAMEQVNASKLGSRELPRKKFAYSENLIDEENLVERSLETLDRDLEGWMGARTFITMGRISPEKDHSKLIDAFHFAAKEFPDARLVILGDGPLRESVASQIRRKGLQDQVFLAGLRSNPFPALRAAGCFVISSNHEGQPMVLLEALALEKPIIATDIEGNRGVLRGRSGLLVDNSASGLAEGMINYLEGKIEVTCFDVAGYRQSILDRFHHVILETKVH